MHVKKYITFSIDQERKVNRLSLPHHWHALPNDSWTISIASGVIYSHENIENGILRIELDELSGIDQYSESRKTLAIVFSNKPEKFHIEPRHLIFHQLNDTTLNDLSLTILNENDQIITPLKNSYLTLCLENMNGQPRERSLFLSVQVPDDGGDIICQLPHAIHLEQRGSWQMCLHSIVMPNMRTQLDDDCTIQVTVGSENEIKSQQKVTVSKDAQSIMSGNNVEYFLSDMEFVLATYLRDRDITQPTISLAKDGDERLKIEARKGVKIDFSRSMAFALGLLETGDESQLISIVVKPQSPFIPIFQLD